MIQYPPVSLSPMPLYKSFFSSIFISANKQTSNLQIIKKNTQNQRYLLNQIQILEKMSNYPGFPKIKSIQNNQYGIPQAIYLQKLGYSLKILNKKCQMYKFTIPMENIINLSLQMLQRIQDLHHCGFIHMDLKPQHFLFENQNPESRLYLIDFGLSITTQQMEKYNQNNIESENKTFIGNLYYSSINRMKCMNYSIKDDLESLIYIIGQLIDGELPWKSVQNNIDNENIIDLYSKILITKIKKSGWKKCGEWIKSTLKTIHIEVQPYYSLRTSICQLGQLQF